MIVLKILFMVIAIMILALFTVIPLIYEGLDIDD